MARFGILCLSSVVMLSGKQPPYLNRLDSNFEVNIKTKVQAQRKFAQGVYVPPRAHVTNTAVNKRENQNHIFFST